MRKNQNRLIVGDHNAICDVCGWKYKASDLRKRWDGYMVCDKDWEPRHPQDFLRAVQDQAPLPWTRPQPTDTFVQVNFDFLMKEDGFALSQEDSSHIYV